jgi:hypothetical protein
MKRQGFILLTRRGKHVWSYPDGEIFKTMKQLGEAHDLSWDDLWDCQNRNTFHFGYLDLAKMKIFRLPRWKKRYPGHHSKPDERETVMSDPIFKREPK